MKKEKQIALYADATPVFRGQNPDRDREIWQRLAAGETSVAIAADMGLTCRQVAAARRRMGLPPLHSGAAAGPAHWHWRGGVITKSGYRYRYCPRHPHAQSSGLVAEHRLVMEETLGRYLTTTEVVDHIDGNRSNNDPVNLRVFANNSEHLSVTLRGRRWTPARRRAHKKAKEKAKAAKAKEKETSAAHLLADGSWVTTAAPAIVTSRQCALDPHTTRSRYAIVDGKIVIVSDSEVTQ